jgi:beta-galactosidase/beta-glucuronidase
VSQGFTRILDLSDGWELVLKKMKPAWAASWLAPAGEPVDLPHCWNADDTFQLGVKPYRGHGTYRKRFSLAGDDPTDGIWTLVAEGFYGTGQVWLNGVRLGNVDGQFLGFQLDCGPLLSASGENRLYIRLTNRCPSSVLPGFPNPDFILHGGLASRVYLVQRPVVHIDQQTVAVTTRNRGNGAQVSIACDLAGLTGVGSHELVWRVRDSSSAEVAETVPIALDPASPRVTSSVEIADASFWSVSSPALYQAVGELHHGGDMVDRITLRFGVRDAELRPRQGFFLNGERVRLQGCNRHESIPGFGQALPEKLQRRDARILKMTGFNFVRLSHYPQHRAFLDACDELGIIVYAEIASWKSVRCGRWLEAAIRQLRGMILRDRNHPSIVIWGLGNEARSRRAYTVLREVVEELDPGRPVTYAENHSGRARLNRIPGVVDVWGINYELSEIERAFSYGRLENVIITECIPYQAGQRGTDRELDHVREVVATMKVVDQHPQLAGYALWAFSDYATMHLDRYQRFSGIVDAWRIPKYAAMVMQARLSPQPFVRICGAWGDPIEGGDDDESGTRRIHIFSNCRKVSLYHEGDLIESLSCELYASCEVPYLGGMLLAVAEGETGTAEYRLRAFSAPVRLALELEANTAGLRETMTVRLRVFDDQGVQVTAFNGEASMQINGPARLNSYTPDHRVVIARGEGRTYFTGTGSTGEVEVAAACDGLEPARVTCSLAESHRKGA